MGDFVISSLPRLLTKELCAAGPLCSTGVAPFQRYYGPSRHRLVFDRFPGASGYAVYLAPSISRRDEDGFSSCLALLFFTLNREDFSFVIHLDRQPRTSRRREAQTGSRARSGSRSERTLDAVEHSRTLMEWWPFLIFHRGGLRIKVINNTCPCHRAVPTTPPEGCASSDSLATHPVAFVRHEKTRPLGSIFLSGPPMGSLVLRPGDSLTILKMALSVSFIRLVSSTNVTQATGR